MKFRGAYRPCESCDFTTSNCLIYIKLSKDVVFVPLYLQFFLFWKVLNQVWQWAQIEITRNENEMYIT